MSALINAADAIAAAVEIERRGHVFYAKIAEKTLNKDDKEFFLFMASEEKRHEGIFSAMLERVGGLPMPAGSNDEEYLMYVRALLDTHNLFMTAQETEILKNPIIEAMRFEKDTLLFFSALEGFVPESEKKAIRSCADEERGHLKMLAKRMAVK